MSFEVTNISKGMFVYKDISWQVNEKKVLNFIPRELAIIIEKNNVLSCNKDVTPLVGLSDIVNATPVLTNTTGTVATEVAGATTIGAISTVATAADGIATLADALNKTTTALNAAIARIEVIENALLTSSE